MPSPEFIPAPAAVINPFADGPADRHPLPLEITRAAALLLGATHGALVPTDSYCPPLDPRQVRRLLQRSPGVGHKFNARCVVAPRQFFAFLANSTILPDGTPPAQWQQRFAATQVRRARDLTCWRDELEILRCCIDNDAPLPLRYYVAYASRSRFFEFFADGGLAKYRLAREAAVVPSEFAGFVALKSSIPAQQD